MPPFSECVGLDDIMNYSRATLLGVGIMLALPRVAESQQLHKYLPESRSVQNELGFAVAIEGAAAAVGAPGDEDDDGYSGSVLLLDAATGEYLTKLLPADGAAGAQFGRSVSMTPNTILIGAPGAKAGSYSGAGAAYLFDRPTGNQLHRLTAADARWYDQFGYAVAMSDGLVVIGAPEDDDQGGNSGSAYVFDADSGAQLRKLAAPDGAPNARFGSAVAVIGSVAVVGAPGDDDLGWGSGAVYVFDATTGQQLRKLVAPDGGYNDAFGSSVAIDGDTIVVGAPVGAPGDLAGEGSAYLFDATTGGLIAILTPGDGAPTRDFGQAVDVDGPIVVVGAADHDGTIDYEGAAFLFDAMSGQQIAMLLPDDADPLDRFGVSVAVSGTTVIGGAPFDEAAGYDAGSAYLFDAPTGSQAAKVLPIPDASYSRFGSAVAIHADSAYVGAYAVRHRPHQSGLVYEYSLTTGQLIGTVLPTDDRFTWFGRQVVPVGPYLVIGGSGAAYQFEIATGQMIRTLLPDISNSDGAFGFAIAATDERIIIGSQWEHVNYPGDGAAYLFNTATGNRVAKLAASDGTDSDTFGTAVAISSEFALVGANGHDANGIRAGAAYLFDPGSGQELRRLLAIDGAEWDYFGSAVALSGQTAIIGAYGDDDQGSGSGSVYLFDAVTGQQYAKLIPNDGHAGAQFGRTLRVDGDLVLIGAIGANGHDQGDGAVYIFQISTGLQIEKIVAEHATSGDMFGSATALSGGIALIGATGDTTRGKMAGAAYVFELDSCSADFNNDGVLDTRDFLSFLTAWAAGDQLADWNHDGVINTADVIAYLNAWVAGC